MSAEDKLPADILAKASVRDGEYAWRPEDIPSVIQAAREANLISIGGQLQFRTPDGICECYWIEVDTYKSVSSELPWPERVERTAAVAATSYAELLRTKDFLKEAASFSHLRDFEKSGGNLSDAICFVWYVEASGARDFVA